MCEHPGQTPRELIELHVPLADPRLSGESETDRKEVVHYGLVARWKEPHQGPGQEYSAEEE